MNWFKEIRPKQYELILENNQIIKKEQVNHPLFLYIGYLRSTKQSIFFQDKLLYFSNL